MVEMNQPQTNTGHHFMNRHRTHPHRSGRHGCRQNVLERLADLFKPKPEDDPEWLRLEDEKLREARLALFGSAPK